MPMIVAPPPEVVASLADLVALIKNVTPQTVKDLQKVSAEYTQAVNDLAKANSESYDKLEQLKALSASVEAAQAALDAQKVEQDAKAKTLAESESQLQSAYINLESRTSEFEASMKVKSDALADREATLNAEMAEVEALKKATSDLKTEMEAKKAAVLQALGA